ncbi:MAG: hypothetical protein KatS3mg110_2561 [Pirellulaceae bacterium]|nr:MAG: hypothetical protein KatS3mg110_2561 [Pirellulaceae bacterium]
MVSSLVRVVYGATVTLLLTLVVTNQALGDDGTINNPTAGTQYLTNSTIGCGGTCMPFNAQVFCRIRRGGKDGPVIKEAVGTAVMGTLGFTFEPPEGGWQVGDATVELQVGTSRVDCVAIVIVQ